LFDPGWNSTIKLMRAPRALAKPQIVGPQWAARVGIISPATQDGWLGEFHRRANIITEGGKEEKEIAEIRGNPH
jgi:hypothetical protein